MDEAENYAELLTSDAAISCFGAQGADEAAGTAEKMKQHVKLGRQSQEATFKRVSQLKKKKFIGSQVLFPELPAQFEPDVLLRRIAPRFNSEVGQIQWALGGQLESPHWFL